MANLSSLMPPGARGYLAGEEQAQEAGSRNLAQLTAATQIRGQLEKLQQEQAWKADIANLGPNPTDEQLSAVARKHGGANAVMQDLTRRSGQENSKQLALSRLAQTAALHQQDYELKLRNATTAEQTAAVNAWDKQVKAYLSNEASKYNIGGQGIPGLVMPSAAPPQAAPSPMSGYSPQEQQAIELVRSGQAISARPTAAGAEVVRGQPSPMSAPQPVVAPPTDQNVPSVVPTTPATMSNAGNMGLEGRFPPVGQAPTQAPLPAPLSPSTPMPPKPLTLADAPAGLTPRKAQEWLLKQSGSSGSVASINPDNANLHGQDYIKTLPLDLQNNVKAITEYRVPFNQLASLRTGERRALMAHVEQADPTFDANKYPIRQAVMKDFTSGKTAGNITSNNMAIAHLGTFYELGQAIQNQDVRVFNAVKNRLASELGKPELNNMAMSSQAVGEELMRVFRQVNASESEAKMFMEKLSTSNSPAQIKGAVATAIDLMKGRLDSLNDQWKRGMDKSTDFPNIVSPKSQDVLKRIGMGGKLGGASNAPNGNGVDTSNPLLR